MCIRDRNHAVHISHDSFRVLVINGLALRHLLIKERQRYFTGTDDSHQLFKLGHLARVGRLCLLYTSIGGLSHFLNDTDGVEEQAGFGPIQPLPPANL